MSQPGQRVTEPWPPPVATNGKAVAALATGVASLLLSVCCLGIAGIVAVVLGVQARREIAASGGAQQGSGLATAGMVTGALAMLVSLLLVVAVILVVVTGNAAFETRLD